NHIPPPFQFPTNMKHETRPFQSKGLFITSVRS
ncbi:hypothetical protein VN97_g13037, partial [Penicillium thymicola]